MNRLAGETFSLLSLRAIGSACIISRSLDENRQTVLGYAAAYPSSGDRKENEQDAEFN